MPILISVTKYSMCLSDESKVSDIFFITKSVVSTLSLHKHTLLGFTKRNKSKTIGPYTPYCFINLSI